MGSPDDDSEAYADEKPQREVSITCGFWIMETPVTQEQYQIIANQKPSHFKFGGDTSLKNSERNPVEQVSWFDASAFANSLSALFELPCVYSKETETSQAEADLKQKGWRLPTEAEWEYACRAGTATPRYGMIDEIAWWAKNSYNRTQPVGQKKPNIWGLQDMIGNVKQWAHDFYSPDAYHSLPNSDPYMSHPTSQRALRGSAYAHDKRQGRAACRSANVPEQRSRGIGFRLIFRGGSE